MSTTTKPWFVLPDEPVSGGPVVVLGAGLAGCHTAFELAQRNIKVWLIDGNDAIAGGASANPAGIVKPYLTRSPCHSNEFYTAAFAYLLNRLDNDLFLREQSQFNDCGVLQLIDRSYASDQAYRICTPKQASDITGVSINKNALYFPRGGYLNPQALCMALTQHPNINVQLNSVVTNIEQSQSQWTLQINTSSELPSTDNNASESGKTLHCDTLILANGEQLNQFYQTRELPITAARGQTSHFVIDTNKDGTHQLRTVITGKNYAIPMNNQILVGATFTRGDKTKQLAEADHEANRRGLESLLPSLQVAQKATAGFCGIRATTPDRLPMVGPVPDFNAYQQDYKRVKHGLPDNDFKVARYQRNLYVIGGFGSRGIVSAPYCASLLAEQLCKSPGNETAEPYSLTHWATLLHPGRFAIRALKRSHTLVHSDA